MKYIIAIILFLSSLFSQYQIEGRWHLVGYEDNVMHQFENNYRYSIYSTDGTFGSIEDAGGTPNPYIVVEDIITIDLFFGNIVNYQMNYICDGQVVEFIQGEFIHSTLFREGYNYIDDSCEEYLENCCQEADTATNDCGGVGCYIPQCTEDCMWEPMQCWGSTGYCWCVDESGVEIEGTSTPSWEGLPDCEEHFEECEDIEYSYDQLHSGFYSECEFNIDCSAVWGDCDVGLGGCHYAINEERYDSMQIDTLVNTWIEGECTSGVCDCMGLPNAQCVNGYCELAYCYDANPEGCFNSGCPDGYECIDDPNYCIPSSCFCSGDFYGEWFCTEDCNGGTCIEIQDILLGDINEDTILNILDIVLMVDMILNNQYNVIADVNEDEAVDILDVVLMVSILIGGLP